MPPRPLTYFEMQTYYQNEPKFNGVYSRNNLPKIKTGIEHFLILATTITGCVSIYAFASLNGIPIGLRVLQLD